MGYEHPKIPHGLVITGFQREFREFSGIPNLAQCTLLFYALGQLCLPRQKSVSINGRGIVPSLRVILILYFNGTLLTLGLIRVIFLAARAYAQQDDKDRPRADIHKERAASRGL